MRSKPPAHTAADAHPSPYKDTLIRLAALMGAEGDVDLTTLDDVVIAKLNDHATARRLAAEAATTATTERDQLATAPKDTDTIATLQADLTAATERGNTLRTWLGVARESLVSVATQLEDTRNRAKSHQAYADMTATAEHARRCAVTAQANLDDNP